MFRSLRLRPLAQRWFGLRGQRTSSSRPTVAARRRVRLSPEILEDRTVPTVFNVGPGDVSTLIADINAANSNDQSNVINLANNSTYELRGIDNSWFGPDGLPAISSNLTISGRVR
ncbi:MAG: hypothetical protein ACRELF_09085 [Gemmataceae bacterium]